MRASRIYYRDHNLAVPMLKSGHFSLLQKQPFLQSDVKFLCWDGFCKDNTVPLFLIPSYEDSPLTNPVFRPDDELIAGFPTIKKLNLHLQEMTLFISAHSRTSVLFLFKLTFTDVKMEICVNMRFLYGICANFCIFIL